MKRRVLITAAAAFLLSFVSVSMAQESELRIELLGSLGTKSSHKGDKVFGRVQSPDNYRGDTVEGRVRESHSGSKLRGGGAVLNFTFETLQHGGQSIAISTRIESFQNSHGDANVDEEGRIVRHGGGNEGKAVAGTAAGGLIGSLAGGWKGAVIGSGLGAAASITIIEITTDTPDIRFEPGSTVTVSAKAHDGAPLDASASSYSSNQTASASSASVPKSDYSSGAATQTTRTSSSASPAASSASAQPVFSNVKNDFIPGEKVIFYDDFTDVDPGDALPHWKVRNGAASVQEASSLRQVTFTKDQGSGVMMSALVKQLPQNFTIESELKIDDPQDARFNWYFHDDAKADALSLELDFFAYENHTLRFIATQPNTGGLGQADGIPMDFSQPVKFGLWVQNGRVRIYINGNRILDVNHVELGTLYNPELETYIGDRGTISYRYFRFAESTPDFSKSIFANGRYVTYGIHFDTDSDRIKDDSATVIQSIAKGLQANPTLNLSIEGHTDNTGKADHNMILSKRRAEAVKNVLVSQFQIDVSRLSTVGMGSTKPLASSDDPQGRPQNRRVEFVKQ